MVTTPVAAAEDAVAKIAKLNRLGLDAFDNLNFDQARALFEQALGEAGKAGLANDPAAARTHLDLGMLFIAGFQNHDDAVAQFRAALQIDPNVKAPAGLFNPEVQTAFDQTKADLIAKSRADLTKPTPPAAPAAPPLRRPPAQPASEDADAARPIRAQNDDGNGEADARDDDDDDDQGAPPSPFFFAIGVGSGLGVAKGHLDANKDITQGNPPVVDNSWSGGLAPSRLGHIVLTGGYFVSPRLLVSIEGRLQIVTGTTTVTTMPSCEPSCQPPSTAFAGLAKASWFLAPAPLRPFVSGGVGAGSIRQVVKLNLTPDPNSADNTTHCGSGGNQACVDTVTGGPLLLAVGGGIAYEIGRAVVLAALTANVGVPNFMLNVDATLGFGLRL